jgi:hypothetical protein
MTLETLESQVAQALETAARNAGKCSELISAGNLKAALDYCRAAGIEPPQCSLVAISENASKLRAAAARKLSDLKWWCDVLEKRVIRDYEGEQFAAGKITNYISDGLAAYMAKRKKRK